MSTQYKHPRNGWSLRELAEKTGVSRRSIIRWTSEPREAYLSRAEQRRQKIHELRSQGLSIRAIAKQLDISVGTVHYSLHKTNNEN